MALYQCEYVPLEPQVRQVGNKDIWEARFRFKVTPERYADGPDEARHIKERTVSVTITGAALDALDVLEEKRQAWLYWQALQMLEQGESQLFITTENLDEHRIDATGVDYPPTSPFAIELRSQIGFRAF